MPCVPEHAINTAISSREEQPHFHSMAASCTVNDQTLRNQELTRVCRLSGGGPLREDVPAAIENALFHHATEIHRQNQQHIAGKNNRIFHSSNRHQADIPWHRLVGFKPTHASTITLKEQTEKEMGQTVYWRRHPRAIVYGPPRTP